MPWWRRRSTALAVYLQFRETPEIQKWLAGTLNKTVCKVSEQEFEQAKSVPDGLVVTEAGCGAPRSRSGSNRGTIGPSRSRTSGSTGE